MKAIISYYEFRDMNEDMFDKKNDVNLPKRTY